MGVVGAVAAALTTALPADAATSGTTAVTFSLTGGALDITVPAAAAFGDFPVNNPTAGGNLGAVVVSDSRGNAGAAWTTSVSSTAFVGSGTAAGNTLPAANIAYDPGVISATNVSASGVPLAALSESPQPTVAGTGGTGINFATWNPSLTVTIPSTAAVAGDYSATVTHSVA